VDVSGSMSGEKMEQARGALRQLLATLSPEDRFRLIRFSSGVESYRREWTAATQAEVREARQWIDALIAEGGTNISGALAEAFRATSPESRLPVVVFITDGLPSAGETNPERIADQAERAGGRARVFAFGVGYDVNTLLLDRLGAATRGSTQYVQPGEDVEQALGVLSAKIRHPVLTDLELADAPVQLREIYPVTLPDLFAGEELIIFGRYEGSGTGNLAITGRRSGQGERFTTRALFADHERDNDFIPRLWASRKLGVLTQQVRLNGANPELVEEIRNTALRYGLLTEYTSYLVQEPELVVAHGDEMQLRLRASVAAAPVAGQAAVLQAEESRAARTVNNSADLAAAQSKSSLDLKRRSDRGAGALTRTVAGRVFRETNGAWTDALHRPNVRIIDVEPFSPAYFALLRRMPELEPYWRELPGVLVAGRAVSLRLAHRGRKEMPESEVNRVVKEFRF
jgi:Ca-activated chloride channel family protein